MCIAFFTLNQPGYKLILASNRDEYLGRPTLPAEWHDFLHPTPIAKSETNVYIDGNGNGRVLSGRDMAKPEGGTWLGISKGLKVGLITNIRLTPPAPHIIPLPNPPSRGLLLKQYLSPKMDDKSIDVHEYLNSHLSSAGRYEGFNLLLFDLTTNQPQVGYLTNRPEPLVKQLHIHGDGPIEDEVECYGISNEPMFQSSNPKSNERWEKIIQGEKRMRNTLEEWSTVEQKQKQEAEKDLVERMFGVLAQNIPINQDDDLKKSTTIQPILLQVKDDSIPTTTKTTTTTNGNGNGIVNNQTQWKGTKTSTVILVKVDGETIFVERDIAELDSEGLPQKGQGERWFTFKGDIRS